MRRAILPIPVGLSFPHRIIPGVLPSPDVPLPASAHSATLTATPYLPQPVPSPRQALSGPETQPDLPSAGSSTPHSGTASQPLRPFSSPQVRRSGLPEGRSKEILSRGCLPWSQTAQGPAICKLRDLDLSVCLGLICERPHRVITGNSETVEDTPCGTWHKVDTQSKFFFFLPPFQSFLQSACVSG